MIEKLLFLSLIGALIGYSTNVIAIKLMFRPYEPTKIFKIQGLIPKRKADIAINIGELVASELIMVEELMDIFIEKTDKEKMKKEIGIKISDAIVEKLPPFIPHTVVTMYIDQFIEEKGDEVAAEKHVKKIISAFFFDYIESEVTQAILQKNLRVDGRKLDEIRTLTSEVGLLPRIHGSGLFSRGETQILSIVTLGAPFDVQSIETMESDCFD